MRSLTFLMLRQAKNRLLELKTKPAKLIIYIVAIGFLAWMVIQAMGMDMPEGYVDANLFKGILAGFFLFSFIASLLPAFTQGASLFEMEDANFLFVAPIKARTVLLYGLVKAFKTILFGSWFMVFQVQWMRSGFGISLGGVILAMVGYVMVAIVCQIMALFIYALTNSRPHRKRAAKAILFALFIPVAVVFLYGLITEGDMVGALEVMLPSLVLDFTPVVGWASAGITAVLLGNNLAGVFFLGLLAVFGAALFGAVYFGNPDYYEDVLGATETAFEKVRAAQEDGAAAISQLTVSDKPVKLKRTGINRGAGASAFFYKHIRESFRSNFFGLWGTMSFVMVIIAIIWSVWARPDYGANVGPADLEGHIFTILIPFIFIKMLTAGMGRGPMETVSHYIYMVPDRPFAKWVWAGMECMLKALVEALIIFGAAGFIIGVPIWFTLAVIAVYVLFTFYLLGISLASLRFTGTNLNTGLLLVIYFATVIIPLVPGVLAGILVLRFAPEALVMTLFLATVSAWMLLVGIGCFALSKGALHNCDMPVMRTDR